MISKKIQLIGTWTLIKKELIRFWRVALQTVAAPVITGILYLVIFSHVLQDRLEIYDGISYTSFLIPGLIMMSLLQNSFANSSSSLIQSKVMGNIIFILLSPLSYVQFFTAFIIGAIFRGLFVGIAIYLLAIIYVDLPIQHPWIVLMFAIFGGGLLGAFGIIAGIWADRFDQMAAFGNFIIMPLSFLSGVFYSIHSLPDAWQTVSKLNPFFYMIDGFRFGFFGQSDVSPYLSLTIVFFFFVALSYGAMQMLKSGFKLRN
tara:strand:- start:102 stop:878 length:777 start_codon:yes stop_codon:yes gene_type:complete